MPKSKENQFWLFQDEVDFRNIKHQVDNLEKERLWDIKNSLNNSWDDDSKNLNVIIENTNRDTKLLYSDFITYELLPIKLRIIKNLENQKISKFKNFFIKLFSWGKIDRNKNIENEISQFNDNCQHIEDKCKTIIENLNDKTNNLLCEQNLQLKIERNQLLQAKVELETILKNNKEKIKQLESNIEQNKERINKLSSENDEYKKVQAGHNKKYVDKFITLEGMVRERDETIRFLTEKKVLLKEEINLRDSGIESTTEAIDSDIDSFNRDKINAQQEQTHNKKRIKARVIEFN